MTDNVNITQGTGTAISTETGGDGAQVQRVKQTWGAVDTINNVDTASGKPMPVQLRGSDGTDVSKDLPVAATLDAETTKVIGTVNIAAAQTIGSTLAPGAGVITGFPVVLPASTTTTIQKTTGATGDYLDHIIVAPTSTAPGSIVIKDGTNTMLTYPGGGTTALLTLTPFTIYVGAVSQSGAWSAVVGANVAGLAVGKFS